jgi:hypothetical protein
MRHRKYTLEGGGVQVLIKDSSIRDLSSLVKSLNDIKLLSYIWQAIIALISIVGILLASQSHHSISSLLGYNSEEKKE